MITLKNLSCGYDKIPCVKNINLEFGHGKITTLVGTNGCGKSTILKTIARLLPPIEGEVLVDGISVRDYSPIQFAKKVAVLPQTRAVPSIPVKMLVSHGRFPHMGFMRKLTETDRNIVDDALNEAGVYQFKDRDLKSLSGGERQKAYIAMVMAQDTDIIFLDEPTTYLDINRQFELLELIKKLNSMGKTIVMVLHDLSHSLIYSDKIVVVGEEKIIMSDTPENVFESGVLEKTFGVKIKKATGDDIEAYYFGKK